jgi:hypothetical protein
LGLVATSFLAMDRLVTRVARERKPAPAKNMPNCFNERFDVRGDRGGRVASGGATC